MPAGAVGGAKFVLPIIAGCWAIVHHLPLALSLANQLILGCYKLILVEFFWNHGYSNQFRSRWLLQGLSYLWLIFDLGIDIVGFINTYFENGSITSPTWTNIITIFMFYRLVHFKLAYSFKNQVYLFMPLLLLRIGVDYTSSNVTSTPVTSAPVTSAPVNQLGLYPVVIICFIIQYSAIYLARSYRSFVY